MKKKLSQEDFLITIKDILGDNYDYSKVVYKGSRSKILIFCKKHNKEFTKYPYQIIGLHQGCPLCGYEKSSIKQRTKFDNFIKSAEKLYGKWYNFLKTDYVNNKTPVTITCPEHGDFKRIPYYFLKGRGCPYCERKIVSKIKKPLKSNNKLMTEDFVSRAKEIFGGKYDYSDTKYIDSKHSVSIICKKHGKFDIMPYAHINLKEGCPECGKIQRSKSNLKKNDKFIEELKDKYGNDFDFSNVDYKGRESKVNVTCRKCGNSFSVQASSLLRNCSCPSCSESSLEKEVEKLLKDNGIQYKWQYKTNWLGLQSLDFYLPYYKTAIECQGRQHFIPVSIFDGEEGFRKTVERDNAKAVKCKNNGVKLLYYAKNNFGNNLIITNKEKLIEEIKRKHNDN